MKFFRLCAVLLVVAVCMPCLRGDDDQEYPAVSWTAFQLALVPDQLSVVPSNIPVVGVNIEPFWGKQRQVTVCNFQPFCGFSDAISGVSVQGFGETERFSGLQLGLVTLSSHFQGVNFSLVTGAWESRGLQVGLANFSGSTAPLGSRQQNVPPGGGLQLGIVNCATSGIQVGLLNYNQKSPFPWMILFNASAR